MLASRVGSLVRFAATVLLFSSPMLQAGGLELPKDAPFVRLQLPDTWQVKNAFPEGVISMTPEGYTFAVFAAPKMKSRDKVPEALTQMAKGIMEKPDVKNAEAGEQEDWESDNGIWSRGVRIDAQSTDGTPWVYVAQFFEVMPGRYLMVTTAAPADADTAEEDHYGSVIASFEAIGE
jgi:hypothetical protein